MNILYFLIVAATMIVSCGQTTEINSGGQRRAASEDNSIIDTQNIDGPSTLSQDTSCLPSSGDPSQKGQYAVKNVGSGRTKIYAPEGLPEGCKVPILHFSNGTGASCIFYTSVLQHWASHGFIATCYESPITGSGTPCMDAIDETLSQLPDIADPTKFGSSGHSQGGGASITCTYLLEQSMAILQKSQPMLLSLHMACLEVHTRANILK